MVVDTNSLSLSGTQHPKTQGQAGRYITSRTIPQYIQPQAMSVTSTRVGMTSSHTSERTSHRAHVPLSNSMPWKARQSVTGSQQLTNTCSGTKYIQDNLDTTVILVPVKMLHIQVVVCAYTFSYALHTCQLMRLEMFSTIRRCSVRVGGPYLHDSEAGAMCEQEDLN